MSNIYLLYGRQDRFKLENHVSIEPAYCCAEVFWVNTSVPLSEKIRMRFFAISFIFAAQFVSLAHCQERKSSAVSAAIFIAQKPLVGQAVPESSDAENIPAPVDYGYAWDQFNHRRMLLWSCRRI
jgi:hypothetical protein